MLTTSAARLCLLPRAAAGLAPKHTRLATWCPPSLFRGSALAALKPPQRSFACVTRTTQPLARRPGFPGFGNAACVSRGVGGRATPTRGLAAAMRSMAAARGYASAVVGGGSGGGAGGAGGPWTADRVKRYARNGAIIGGVCVFVYIGAKIALDVSGYFINATFMDLGSIGFYLGGVLSTVAIMMTYRFLRRFRSIHPERLYAHVYKRLSHDPQIQQHLGKQIQAGKFKAYSGAGGMEFLGLVPTKEHLMPVSYKKRSLQMVFQMSGELDSAMVSLQVTKNLSGEFEFQSLALDMMNSGKRVVVEGSPQDVVYQGVMRLR